MNELFYFNAFDLMTQLKSVTSSDNVLVKYWSHRKMQEVERSIVERFFMMEYLAKTGYFRSSRSIFVYGGVNEKLRQPWLRHTGKLPGPSAQEVEVAAAEYVVDYFKKHNFITEKI